MPPPLDPWTDERVLGVTDALWQYTEFFQFASRLAITAAGDEEVFVGISLHGLQGRSLKVDSPNRAPFVEDYRTQMEAFLYERTYHRSELVASHLDYARSAATDLFERFGWHPTAEILRGAQDELLRLH